LEVLFDLSCKISLDLIVVTKLGQGPAAMRAEVVHTGHPAGLHRRSLLLRIQSPVTFDFNHEVEQGVIAVAAQRKQSQAKTE